MILSCKYCLSQTHLCPRCEGPVITRRITEFAHAEAFSTSLILCTNLTCKNYGEFHQQTTESIVPYVCDNCKEKWKGKEMEPEQHESIT